MLRVGSGLVDFVFSGWFDFGASCCVYLVLVGCFDCVVWELVGGLFLMLVHILGGLGWRLVFVVLCGWVWGV